LLAEAGPGLSSLLFSTLVLKLLLVFSLRFRNFFLAKFPLIGSCEWAGLRGGVRTRFGRATSRRDSKL